MVRLDLHHLLGGQGNLRRLGLSGVAPRGVDADAPQEKLVEIVAMEHQPPAAPAPCVQMVANDEHPDG